MEFLEIKPKLIIGFRQSEAILSMKLSRLLLAVFVITLSFYPSSGHSETSPSKELKVAVALGLIGDAAYHANGIRNGIEMAAEHLKQQGWQVDILFEDDQTNPAKTVSAFQFLLARGYRQFIGPTWSYQVNAVKNIIAANHVIAVVPGGSSDINGGAIEGVFNMCPSRFQQVPVLTKWLSQQKFKRAVILTPNGDWGEIHRQVFTDAFKNSGGAIVSAEQFDYGVPRSFLQALLLKASHKNADIVLTTGAAADIANLVIARNTAHLNMPVMATEDVYDALALKLLAPSDLGNNTFGIGWNQTPKFVSEYKLKTGQQPPPYADRGYDALMVLSKAVAETDGSTKEIERFLKQVDLSGVSGKIKFDKNNDLEFGDYRVFSSPPTFN